jgi:hypothetical protein
MKRRCLLAVTTALTALTALRASTAPIASLGPEETFSRSAADVPGIVMIESVPAPSAPWLPIRNVFTAASAEQTPVPRPADRGSSGSEARKSPHRSTGSRVWSTPAV